MAGKFELYTDAAGKYRFRLKAGNGEIIAVGEAYSSKTAAMNGIDSIKRQAAEASVHDMTSDMPNKTASDKSMHGKEMHAKPAQSPSQSQSPKPSAQKPAKPKQPAGMTGTTGTMGTGTTGMTGMNH
jgi:uncharacterized protein YegP (UPF0339 family)